jgi:hypothetical protein
MSGEERQVRKIDLALALAKGVSAKKWGDDNEVATSTAYRWAGEKKVRALVNSIRGRALDRSVGRLSKRLVWAAEGIVQLADTANSESVRLAALRAISSEMIKASRFGGLEDRMTEIEERLDARAGNES